MYASAAARLLDHARSAEAARRGAPPPPEDGAASITTRAFHESVEAQLRGVLRDHVAPQHDKGTGRLAAELGVNLTPFKTALKDSVDSMIEKQMIAIPACA